MAMNHCLLQKGKTFSRLKSATHSWLNKYRLSGSPMLCNLRVESYSISTRDILNLISAPSIGLMGLGTFTIALIPMQLEVFSFEGYSSFECLPVSDAPWQLIPTSDALRILHNHWFSLR